MSLKKRYLVIADVSREQYASAEYLFGIFDAKEEAIQFMRDWKPKRKDKYDNWGDYKSFNFVKPNRLNREYTDEELEQWYIREFDGKPLCVGSYIE